MSEQTILEFEELTFQEQEDKVKVNFLKSYSFYIDKQNLENIGPYKIRLSYLVGVG